jgi:hypothetical protein
MDERTRPPLARLPRAAARSGLGVACFEAQADGVPCSDLGTRCGDCDRSQSRRESLTTPPTAPGSLRTDDHA